MAVTLLSDSRDREGSPVCRGDGRGYLDREASDGVTSLDEVCEREEAELVLTRRPREESFP